MNSGKPARNRRPLSQLGARDRRIINDLIRLRVLTNEAIAQLHLPANKANATVKVTSRLVKTDWLKAVEYDGRKQYFVAGSNTIRTFGLPVSRSRPLGPQSLATHLAILEFVADRVNKLNILTNSETAQLIGEKTKHLIATPHAIDCESRSDSKPLQLLKVNLGGSPNHIAKKLEADVRLRAGHPYYANLIEQRRLIIVVLVPTTIKQQLIESAIAKRSWPKGIRFNLFTVSSLTQLIGGIQDVG